MNTGDCPIGTQTKQHTFNTQLPGLYSQETQSKGWIYNKSLQFTAKIIKSQLHYLSRISTCATQALTLSNWWQHFTHKCTQHLQYTGRTTGTQPVYCLLTSYTVSWHLLVNITNWSIKQHFTPKCTEQIQTRVNYWHSASILPIPVNTQYCHLHTMKH